MTTEEITYQIQEAGFEVMAVRHSEDLSAEDPWTCFEIDERLWLILFTKDLNLKVRTLDRTSTGKNFISDLTWSKCDQHSNMLWPCDFTDRRVYFTLDELHVVLMRVRRILSL